MLSSICLIRHSFIFLQIYDYFVKPTRKSGFFREKLVFYGLGCWLGTPVFARDVNPMLPNFVYTARY